MTHPIDSFRQIDAAIETLLGREKYQAYCVEVARRTVHDGIRYGSPDARSLVSQLIDKYRGELHLDFMTENGKAEVYVTDSGDQHILVRSFEEIISGYDGMDVEDYQILRDALVSGIEKLDELYSWTRDNGQNP